MLLSYVFGLPKAEIKTTHEIGPPAVELLTAIAQSERHRKALEQLNVEREQRRVAVTVEPG